MKDLLRSKLKLSILNTLIASRPLIIYLTLMMVYILLFIYFADPCLCDSGETLYDLKVNLSTETHGYRVHVINYEMIMDTYNLMTRRNLSDRNFQAEVDFLHAARHIMRDISASSGRIDQMVTRIRALEPTFESPLQAINYLRVTR